MAYNRLSGYPAAVVSPGDDAGIYAIINAVNLKVYIGSAKNFRRRWNSHRADLHGQKHASIYLQRAFNKDKEAFEFVIVEETEAEKSTLIQREQFWMDFYRSANPEFGYNISPTASSCLGLKQSPEVVEKKKLILKGRKHTPEQCLAKSIRQRGKKRGKLTEEQKLRISLGRRGIFQSREVILRQLETRRRRRIKWKPVIQMDKEGKEIKKFDSIFLAAQETHTQRANLSAVCMGRRPLAGGFRWKYG